MANRDLIKYLIVKYVKEAYPVYLTQVKVAQQLPANSNRKIWFNPEEKELWFSWSDQDTDTIRQAVKYAFALDLDKRISKVSEHTLESPRMRYKPWMLIKSGLDLKTVTEPVGQALGWLPGGISSIYGGLAPSPVAATIGTGLLGAGLGYLGGRIGEYLAPDVFERNQARKKWMMLGGLAGMLPGAYWASINARNGQSIFSQWPHGQPPGDQLDAPNHPKPNDFKFQPHFPREIDNIDEIDRNQKLASNVTSGPIVVASGGTHHLEPEVKMAAYEAYDLGYRPMIPVDSFGMMVWRDPYTDPACKAMVSGMVDAAAMHRQDADYVSPADIARIAVGAGIGYGSGMLLGKTLGALAGLTPEAQMKLQQLGTWAGLLKSVSPLVMPR